ncbi:hypothetical protein ACA910_006648 [Epithemia clementina (nom. ined.)]
MMLRLVVFDLDYTIWQPEMYQLWGKPKLVPIESKKGLSPSIFQEARTKEDGYILIDPKQGSPIRVFPGANNALVEINRLRRQGHDIRSAVASKTDEPSWARICMDHLVVGTGNDETTLAECFEDRVEIGYGSKSGHLQRLQKQTGVPWNEMCFFDNEWGNIRDVLRSCPGVKCIYTPDGMTQKAWEEAKAHFGISL